MGSTELFLKMDKVSQIALVVHDVRASVKHFWDELGVGPWNIWELDHRTMSDMTLYGKPAEYSFRVAMTSIGDVAIELVQPLKGNSIFSEFLEKKGGGLHHLKYKVPDTEAVLNDFKKTGGRILQSARIGEGSFYYLDTEDKFGFIIELSTGRALGAKSPDEIYPPQ